MTTRKTKQRAANAALTIFLLTVSIIVLSPLLLALLNSFKTLSEITYDVAALPETWQTANYERAWNSLNFPRALLNSLLVNSSEQRGRCAHLLHGSIPHRPPPDAQQPCALQDFSGRNDSAVPGGHDPADHRNQKNGTDRLHRRRCVCLPRHGRRHGCCLPTAALSRQFRATLRRLPEIDGCTELGTFFHVVFPLLRPTTYTLIVINTFWFWNDFLLPEADSFLGAASHDPHRDSFAYGPVYHAVGSGVAGADDGDSAGPHRVFGHAEKYRRRTDSRCSQELIPRKKRNNKNHTGGTSSEKDSCPRPCDASGAGRVCRLRRQADDTADGRHSG